VAGWQGVPRVTPDDFEAICEEEAGGWQASFAGGRDFGRTASLPLKSHPMRRL